jgi:acyl-CoA synthetase (AMP-forming)/AMP-acid ligase II
MPLFHTAGCGSCTLGPIQARATQVLMPFFDPALLLELNESEHGAVFAGVPTMLLAALDHPDFPRRDLASTRLAFSGGTLVPPQLVRRVRQTLGIPFAIVYAQTEASPVITGTRITDSPDDQAETVGRPLPQTEVKIVDPATGQTTPPGRTGEICTRGYHVMTDIVTVRASLQGFEFLNNWKDRGLPPKIQKSADLPTYSSLPTTFITPDALRRLGWESAQAGWLLETREPPTDEQIAAARDMAVDTGMTLETHSRPETSRGRWRVCGPGPPPSGRCWPSAFSP